MFRYINVVIKNKKFKYFYYAIPSFLLLIFFAVFFGYHFFLKPNIALIKSDIETFVFVQDNITKYNLSIDITSQALKNKFIQINTTLKFEDKEPNERIIGICSDVIEKYKNESR